MQNSLCTVNRGLREGRGPLVSPPTAPHSSEGGPLLLPPCGFSCQIQGRKPACQTLEDCLPPGSLLWCQPWLERGERSHLPHVLDFCKAPQPLLTHTILLRPEDPAVYLNPCRYQPRDPPANCFSPRAYLFRKLKIFTTLCLSPKQNLFMVRVLEIKNMYQERKIKTQNPTHLLEIATVNIYPFNAYLGVSTHYRVYSFVTCILFLVYDDHPSISLNIHSSTRALFSLLVRPKEMLGKMEGRGRRR